MEIILNHVKFWSFKDQIGGAEDGKHKVFPLTELPTDFILALFPFLGVRDSFQLTKCSKRLNSYLLGSSAGLMESLKEVERTDRDFRPHWESSCRSLCSLQPELIEESLCEVEEKIKLLELHAKRLCYSRAMLKGARTLFSRSSRGKIAICDEGKSIHRCDEGGLLDEIQGNAHSPWRLATAGQPMETGVHKVKLELAYPSMVVTLGVAPCGVDVEGPGCAHYLPC